MKIDQALKQVFSTESGDDNFRKRKYRFKKGKLSIELKESILIEYGYKKKQESDWEKSKQK